MWAVSCFSEGDIASFRSYIDGLPLDDAPETFGLHENADITLQQKETRSACVLCPALVVLRYCTGFSRVQGSDDNGGVDSAACIWQQRRPQP